MQGDDLKKKDKDKRKVKIDRRAGGVFWCPFRWTLLHMCRDLSRLASLILWQDTELAQQCHCLAFHMAVCCNQEEKSKLVGGCSWSQGLEYGNMTGLEAWTLGRGKWESRGSCWSQGAWVWDWVWADLLCNANPWGIRSCNRRGEVAARSLGMLTLRIPPP